jgi:hypothetical protein
MTDQGPGLRTVKDPLCKLLTSLVSKCPLPPAKPNSPTESTGFQPDGQNPRVKTSEGIGTRNSAYRIWSEGKSQNPIDRIRRHRVA